MARSSIKDPFDKYRWKVNIQGFTKLGFHQTQTPEMKIVTRSYKEGGAHLNPRQIVDQIEYTPITLTRGTTIDTSFAIWAAGAQDVASNNGFLDADSQIPISLNGGDVCTGFAANLASTTLLNSGASVVPSNNGNLKDFRYRREVRIEHIGRDGRVDVVYVLYNAFPIGYKPASDFDALGDDAVSIESITLGYEGFEVLYSGVVGALLNIAANYVSENTPL